jgi:hypothetical protein
MREAVSFTLRSLELTAARCRRGPTRPLCSAGRQVGVERLDLTRFSRRRFVQFIVRRLASHKRAGSATELWLRFARLAQSFIPSVAGRFGPACRQRLFTFLSRSQRIIFELCSGWERGSLNCPGRNRWIVGWLDQPFSEASRRWLGPIASAPDRQIGAFSLTASFLVLIAAPVTGSFFQPGRSRRYTASRRLERFRASRAAAVVAAAAATRVALPLALTRVGPGFVKHALGAIEILRLDVRDMQKSVTADREVDKGGLDRRLKVDDSALVDVARVALVAGSLHIELFENAVLDDGDPAFFGLKDIDQHFFLHAISFRD